MPSAYRTGDIAVWKRVRVSSAHSYNRTGTTAAETPWDTAPRRLRPGPLQNGRTSTIEDVHSSLLLSPPSPGSNQKGSASKETKSEMCPDLAFSLTVPPAELTSPWT